MRHNDRALILQELHHRVKNNLQILQSFISLEISKTNGCESCLPVLERLYARLHIICEVHQNIYNLPSTPHIMIKEVLVGVLPMLRRKFTQL